MKLFARFRRDPITRAASVMAKAGVEKRRSKVLAMKAELDRCEPVRLTPRQIIIAQAFRNTEERRARRS